MRVLPVASVTRIVLVDDDHLVGLGIATVLRLQTFDVVASASSIDEAIDVVLANRPDVVICDVMFRGEPAGLDIMPKLNQTPAQGTPVLFLSSFVSPYLVTRARDTGAAGYLPKDVDTQTLVSAITIVERGGQVFPARLRAERMPSTREVEVIRLVADGLSTDEVATRLGLSPRTVDTHLARLYERCEVASRTQLVTYALGKGWIIELPADGRVS